MNDIHLLAVGFDDLHDLLTRYAPLYAIGDCVLSVTPTLLKESDVEHSFL